MQLRVLQQASARWMGWLHWAHRVWATVGEIPFLHDAHCCSGGACKSCEGDGGGRWKEGEEVVVEE